MLQKSEILGSNPDRTDTNIFRNKKSFVQRSRLSENACLKTYFYHGSKLYRTSCTETILLPRWRSAKPLPSRFGAAQNLCES